MFAIVRRHVTASSPPPPAMVVRPDQVMTAVDRPELTWRMRVSLVSDLRGHQHDSTGADLQYQLTLIFASLVRI